VPVLAHKKRLGDTAETPRFVETLPRRGCRVIGEVEQITDLRPGNRGLLAILP